MDDPNEYGDDYDDETNNPLGHLGGINQLFEMLAAGGNFSIPGMGADAPTWDKARQAAGALAAQGKSESNIDPMVRIQFEQLARVAELQVAGLTGLTISRSGSGVTVVPVTRSQWSASTIDAYRPLFETLAGSIGDMMKGQLGSIDFEEMSDLAAMLPPGLNIDMPALISGLTGFIGPAMTMSMAGSIIGQLGSRAFGSYDLPIPRPPSDRIEVVGAVIDEFAEDWSLPADDLRLYVCIVEIAHHAVVSLPHVRQRLTELLTQHASGFEADTASLEAEFGDLNPDDPLSMDAIQSKMIDPSFMLNAIRSDGQREVLLYIDALVACIEGYVDWVADSIGATLIGSYSQVAEAMRRRRVETDEPSRFVEQLFGLELTQPNIDRGSTFIESVVSRSGSQGLGTLWSDATTLPTPNELKAAGVWLERVGLSGATSDLPELTDSLEIPDFPDLDA